MRTSSIGIMVVVLSGVFMFSGCAGMGRRGVQRSGRGAIEDDIMLRRLGEIPGQMNIINSVSFENVLFEYDSSRIGTNERDKIETVSEYLKRNPDVGVIVEGHCDERGSREYNMALGERRALAARAYLIGLGIDGVRVHTVSYGAEKPLRLGHDEESWMLNRRAEFIPFRQ